MSWSSISQERGWTSWDLGAPGPNLEAFLKKCVIPLRSQKLKQGGIPPADMLLFQSTLACLPGGQSVFLPEDYPDMAKNAEALGKQPEVLPFPATPLVSGSSTFLPRYQNRLCRQHRSPRHTPPRRRKRCEVFINGKAGGDT